MRIAALIAAFCLTTGLVAGCSHTGGDHSGQNPTTAPGSSTSVATPAAKPSAAPAAGAPISAVISWIEAGHPADPARYHVATRDGVPTQLGDDIAFLSPSGPCTTDSKHTGGAVSCLVKLTNPPPPPATSYGEWKGGWVDFDGGHLQVGASRGDPGPFVYGDGTALADGDSLQFGDYRCRADATGVFCVNYAHQSAARFSGAGIEPFGCLRSVPPPDGVGVAFSCS